MDDSFSGLISLVTCMIFSGGDLGKLHVVNDLVDGLLYLGWTFHLLNYLEVQTGVAVKVSTQEICLLCFTNSMDDLKPTTYYVHNIIPVALQHRCNRNVGEHLSNFYSSFSSMH